jgi:MoaA/NifB/PqqE/SkfB family radical SAM enzyme
MSKENKAFSFFLNICRAAMPESFRKALVPALVKVLPALGNSIWLVDASSYRKNGTILYIGVQIVDHCNFSCKSCFNFSPIAREHFMDKAVFINDLRRLAELSNGKLRKLALAGGETLLHPDLLDFLKEARALFPEMVMQIMTNGILLKSRDETFWKTCAETKTEIQISFYPINIPFDELQKSAQKYGVELVYDAGGDDSTPTAGGGEAKFMEKLPVDIDGKQDAKKNFHNCCRAGCAELRDGKIFACPNANSIQHFNLYFNKNVPVTKKDYIDIYKAKSVQEIIKFTEAPTPFCAYCNINKWEKDLKWEASKMELSEWI